MNRLLGDCSSCGGKVLSYTGATTTPDGAFLCSGCSLRLKESLKLSNRPAPARGRIVRQAYPEPPPVDGARWIQLGDRRLALVDAADFDRASVKSWFILGGHAVRREQWGGQIRHDYLHRFVLGLDPARIDDVVEFIDKNPLNCRRSNLRVTGRRD